MLLGTLVVLGIEERHAMTRASCDISGDAWAALFLQGLHTCPLFILLSWQVVDCLTALDRAKLGCWVRRVRST